MRTTSTAPKRRTGRRLRPTLAAIVALTLTASACSSDTDTTTADTTTADTTTADTTTADTTTADTTTADTTTADTAAAEQSSADHTTDDASVTAIDDEGTTSVEADRLSTELDALPIVTISDADRDGLVFMREEEKLALDVYQELHDMWGLPIFDNISAAEQTHTDSVKSLLDRWGIADPALDKTAGVFDNADLQALYDDLIARGSESITEALLVGALIEDLDIADLQARASNDPAIALVYSNLEKGSRNHLRAFIKQLEAKNGTYTPSYITQADFDAIVSSPTERGRNN